MIDEVDITTSLSVFSTGCVCVYVILYIDRL